MIIPQPNQKDFKRLVNEHQTLFSNLINTFIWKLPINKVYKERGTISSYLTYAPWMHFCWSWYLVSLVHLKPTIFENATHEFLVVALDPDKSINLEGPFYPLQPVSIAQQFIAESDEAAEKRIEKELKKVVDKGISLDSDASSYWKRILLSK